MGYLFKRNWWWWLMTCNTDWLSVLVTDAADQSRLSVWLVDGDVYRRGLLKFALSEQNFAHSCVLLVASLTRPWDILDSLTRWSDVLSTHVHRLKLAPNVRKQQEDASTDTSLISHFFLTKYIVHCIKNVQTVVSVKMWFWQIVFTVKMVKFCF